LVPQDANLVGYAYLVKRHGIQAPVRFPSCVSLGYVHGGRTDKAGWRVFEQRYWPGDKDVDHLVFALKSEPFDLLCLKRILDVLSEPELTTYIRSNPTGIYSRKIFFLYEWLHKVEFDIPDCPKCRAVELLNNDNYCTGAGVYSKRHRLNNNLLGNQSFCPIIRKTPLLRDFFKLTLREKAMATIAEVGSALVARAAAFLLLADSQASFTIEGERAPAKRIERWGKAVAQAGRYPLSMTEIVRLQKIIIQDMRFTGIGLRTDGVYLGERDVDLRPLPEFIGARPESLAELIDGMVAANQTMTAAECDPVLQAAAIAFGFVYIHPLEDGNGRLHRYLIHHVLAERGFSPPGLIFPVSSVMLNSIEHYRDILRHHTQPLMDFIDWDVTEKMNVRVVNQTRDLYCYFDCTEACEYLYECVRETIETTLPDELRHLRSFDRAMDGLRNLLDMPDNLAKSLIIFIRQNHGALPKKRRAREFAKLTDAEVLSAETIVQNAFDISNRN
jgi:hypothetical protein